MHTYTHAQTHTYKHLQHAYRRAGDLQAANFNGKRAPEQLGDIHARHSRVGPPVGGPARYNWRHLALTCSTNAKTSTRSHMDSCGQPGSHLVT